MLEKGDDLSELSKEKLQL